MRASVPLLSLLAACGAAPNLLTADSEAMMAEARRLFAEGNLSGTLEVLAQYDKHRLPAAMQPPYVILLARTQLALGDPWETFVALRDFADDHPHSELREQAIELEFAAGSTLSQSDAGFLFFWSDKRGARACLEHLITRYPNCPQVPDALRILGELALENRDYLGAEDRFRELLRRHPESEWAPLARFRYAMSIVASLRGPQYDLERMENACKELRVFLEKPPENPQFVAEAAAALDQILAWRAEHHLGIADFYATVGNGPGEVYHLQQASAPEFAATAGAAIARERLQQRGSGKGGKP